jgi:hypothetical protein
MGNLKATGLFNNITIYIIGEWEKHFILPTNQELLPNMKSHSTRLERELCGQKHFQMCSG